MTGKRLGRSVNGYHVSCARAIVGHVVDRRLPAHAAVIAVTTAIAESTLHNYTLAVDHDSLGLFQQRPSMGWGSPEQLVDPGFATGAFLNKMIRTYPSHSWLAGDIGQICQRIQNSAFPAAYSPEVHDAQLIVEQLWPRTGAPAVTPTVPTVPSTPTASPQPKGPFQRSLLRTGTGQGPTDARHQVMLADWNVDGTSDLVVIQQSGTTGGGTEVRIMNGLANFTYPLLLTATVLGPTDARHVFSVADWNTDGRPDLIVTQRSGTASGRTEVRVLDGASFLQRYLQETVTALGPTDTRHAFSVADWNTDGRPDLIVTQRSGTASRRTEVRVLDGASNLQRTLRQTSTALGPLDARQDVSMLDWNGDRRLDLVVLRKSGTSGNRTVVQVLDGASTFQRFLVRDATAQVQTDDRHSLSATDWDRDGRMDLMVVQRWGTASGRTEAHVLAG